MSNCSPLLWKHRTQQLFAAHKGRVYFQHVIAFFSRFWQREIILDHKVLEVSWDNKHEIQWQFVLKHLVSIEQWHSHLYTIFYSHEYSWRIFKMFQENFTHSLVWVRRDAQRRFQAGSVFVHTDREVSVALVHRGNPFLYFQGMGVALVTKPIRQLDQQLYPLFGLLSIERCLGRGGGGGRKRRRDGRRGGSTHKEKVNGRKKELGSCAAWQPQ